MSRVLKEKAAGLLAVERGTVFKAGGADVEIALAYPTPTTWACRTSACTRSILF